MIEQKIIQVYIGGNYPNLDQLNQHLSEGWGVVVSNNTATYILYVLQRDTSKSTFEWIPVTEKLPLETKWYMGYSLEYGFDIVEYNVDKNTWLDSTMYDESIGITHWGEIPRIVLDTGEIIPS